MECMKASILPSTWSAEWSVWTRRIMPWTPRDLRTPLWTRQPERAKKRVKTGTTGRNLEEKNIFPLYIREVIKKLRN